MPDPIKPVWVAIDDDPEYLEALEEDSEKDRTLQAQENGLPTY